MNKNILEKLKSAFLLMAILWTFVALTQDAQDEDSEQEQLNESELLDTDLTPEELAAAENNELVLEEDSEVDGQENSNSRFIPTEQISQDLGVSFPVDI